MEGDENRAVKLAAPADDLLCTRLRQLGIEIEYVSEEEMKVSPFPTCMMNQSVTCMPFVSSVQCGYVAASLGIWYGRVYVLNLFGRSIVVWRVTEGQA